jgi:uncharacterized NAD-dependent epimerase/dehydratase family protein
VKVPPLADFIRLHEALVAHLRPAPVVAVSLNTYDLSERAARQAIERVSADTGLPTTDPVRFNPAPIVDAIDTFHQQRQRHGARSLSRAASH